MILFSGVSIGSQDVKQGQDAECRNVGVLGILCSVPVEMVTSWWHILFMMGYT